MAGLAPVIAEAVAGSDGPLTIAFTSFPAEAVRQLEQLCVVSAHELLLDEVSWHRRPDLICAKFMLIGSLGVYPQVEYILPLASIRGFTPTATREEGFWVNLIPEITTSLGREAADWPEITTSLGRKPQ